MGQTRKTPFKITPVICRYLRDIQNRKEDIDDPTIQTSSTWFLVRTWEEKEDYTSDSELNLESLKAFMEEEGIAHFPTFQEYEKKHGTNYSIQATQGYLHNLETNERFDFLKSFPVEVLDLEKLKKLREVSCTKNNPEQSSQFVSRQKLSFDSNTISILGLKPRRFDEERPAKIFALLWKDREHFVKGDVNPDKEGNYGRALADFAYRTDLISSRDARVEKLAESADIVRDVVGNIQRYLAESKARISLSLKDGKVLLTVREG
ncbi:MAG: hypothetical protein AAB921_04190 [Patescibacteria group bacterium]